MTTTETGIATRLGFQPGTVVQEIGWEEDSDDELRKAIETAVGSDLVEEDYEDVVDVALLWFRDSDGDLVDALVDARTPLADQGHIWLLTPKSGRSGYVEPSEIGESAAVAGLTQTSSTSAATDWNATRFVTPKTAR